MLVHYLITLEYDLPVVISNESQTFTAPDNENRHRGHFTQNFDKLSEGKLHNRVGVMGLGNLTILMELRVSGSPIN